MPNLIPQRDFGTPVIPSGAQQSRGISLARAPVDTEQALASALRSGKGLLVFNPASNDADPLWDGERLAGLDVVAGSVSERGVSHPRHLGSIRPRLFGTDVKGHRAVAAGGPGAGARTTRKRHQQIDRSARDWVIAFILDGHRGIDGIVPAHVAVPHIDGGHVHRIATPTAHTDYLDVVIVRAIVVSDRQCDGVIPVGGIGVAGSGAGPRRVIAKVPLVANERAVAVIAADATQRICQTNRYPGRRSSIAIAVTRSRTKRLRLPRCLRGHHTWMHSPPGP